MTVHPFPEPEPENPISSFFDNMFGLVPVSNIIGDLSNVFGDQTLEGLWDEVKDMPVRDVVRAVFGIISDDKGETA